MEHHDIMSESETITVNLRAQLHKIEQPNEFCDQAIAEIRALRSRANPEPQIETSHNSERIPLPPITSSPDLRLLLSGRGTQKFSPRPISAPRPNDPPC